MNDWQELDSTIQNERLVDRNLVLSEIEKWITYGEYKYSNATEYLVNRIKNLPVSFRWIPVREQLPKEDEHVMVSCDTGYVTDDYFSKWAKEDGEPWFESFTDLTEDQVIAWAPIPRQYKPEGE